MPSHRHVSYPRITWENSFSASEHRVITTTGLDLTARQGAFSGATVGVDTSMNANRECYSDYQGSGSSLANSPLNRSAYIWYRTG